MIRPSSTAPVKEPRAMAEELALEEGSGRARSHGTKDGWTFALEVDGVRDRSSRAALPRDRTGLSVGATFETSRKMRCIAGLCR